VLRGIVLFSILTMQAYASDTQLLYVYRDFVRPGAEARYIEIEQDAARICRDLKCPHPYIGIESLTGPKQCWWQCETQDACGTAFSSLPPYRP